jgi:purine-nucleoside phosphorylase
MRYPIYPDKYNLEALYGPQDLVSYRKRIARMPGLDSPQAILFCLERSLPRRMRWRIRVKRTGGMNGDLYALSRPAGKVGIMTGFGGGSPMTVELAEEFTAMGASRMILMTWGGMLQPGMKAGDIVVVDRAIRDEGTSYHYLPPDKYVDADAELADQLGKAIQMRGGECVLGTSWTTDAPFRETIEEVRQYQSEGVKTVEMESAGLFTVGKVRGIAAAAVVVGMDSLAELRWHAPDRLSEIMGSLEIVYTAALDVLKGA